MTPSEKIRLILKLLEDTSKSDVEMLMLKPRYQGMKKKDIKKVTDLISYLDQFAAFSKYRLPNANYDDAYYINLPISLVNKVTGLTEQDLDKIVKTSGSYMGHILEHRGKITIFGRE
jgi:hypothetical protein